MYYGTTKLATDWNEKEITSWGVRIIKFLLFFVPRANSDQEKLYKKVKKWALEVNENGIPNREVALDEDDNVLFSSPNNRNTGFWTDSPNVFKKDELEPLDQSQFEKLWEKTKENA